MKRDPLRSELIGQSYPNAVQIGTRLRRDWIVRTVRSLPDADMIHELQQRISNDINAALEAAYAASVTLEQLEHAKPLIQFIRLDECRLLVRTEFADHEHSVGDEAMAAQWGTLQRLDQELEFEELQGLPADWWFPLWYAREGRKH